MKVPIFVSWLVTKRGAGTFVNVANAAIALDFANGAGIGTLTGDGTHFGEAAANDGSISNSLTFTLTVATFTNVSPLVAGLHYTITPVPEGLLFSLTRADDTTLTAHLAGNAAAHTAPSPTSPGA